MQTLTYFRKPFLIWHSWKPLLVLFIFASQFISYKVSAQAYTSSSITINASVTGASTTSTTYFGTNPKASTPKFSNSPLGTNIDPFNNQGTLVISAIADGINPRGTAIIASSLYYRVYKQGTSTASLAFTKVDMSLTSASNTLNPTTYAASPNIDLLEIPRKLGGGNYIIDIYYEAIAQDDPTDPSSDSNPYFDPANNAANPFSATFSVAPPNTTPAGATTIWISKQSTDWAIASNWSNGVPTSAGNAIIPTKDSIPTVQYPILNDPLYNYSVNNLTLKGFQDATAAQISINAATLSVYGNLTQVSGGLTGVTTGTLKATDASKNSTLIFAGADQVIQGALVVSDIIIAGSGTKSTIDVLTPTNILAFQPASAAIGAILQTASLDGGSPTPLFDTTKRKYIQLGANAIISVASGQSETTSSFIRGVTRADATLSAGNPNSFGNIGIEVKPNHNPGAVYAYRVVGQPLKGPLNTSAVPIKRYYQIVGDDNSNSASTASSTLDVIFHYLPSIDELYGIMESNLTMYRTTTNGVPYEPLNGTQDLGNHTITRFTINSLTDFKLTLGDKTNPLPVSLIAFTATRSGQNTLLAWATATEQNSAGFEVQVSTDGASFRKLAFVASQSPNSSQKLAYTYTDAEAGKTGTRYYRLRQLDLTGEEAFSPVRVVNFDGLATAGALSAYPNPFVDKVAFNLDATAIGANGSAHVQLMDMTGRIVREQNLAVQNASLMLDNLNDLRSGLYMVRITLPDGSAKTLRVQKQ